MLIWALVLAAVTVLFFSIYPSVEKDGDQFIQLLQNYPKSVLKALGVQVSTITSILGFYAYFYLYVMLCGAIQAMNLGIGILSKEVSGKTAEFILTKPVKREQILTAKLLAVLVVLVLTNLFFIAVSYTMANVAATEDINEKAFFFMSLSNLFVQLVFAALGFLVSSAFSRIRSVLPISLGTVFAFFSISMFGSVFGDNVVRYLTPFKYFDLSYIMRHSSYEASYLGMGAAVVVVAVIASYMLFTKKDIHAA